MHTDTYAIDAKRTGIEYFADCPDGEPEEECGSVTVRRVDGRVTFDAIAKQRFLAMGAAGVVVEPQRAGDEMQYRLVVGDQPGARKLAGMDGDEPFIVLGKIDRMADEEFCAVTLWYPEQGAYVQPIAAQCFLGRSFRSARST